MNSKDIMIVFDTTGSMYPCLTQVRNNVESLVKKLFDEIPEVRISIMAHGDYCDERSTYVTKMMDFSIDKDKICHFIKNVEATHGGDAPECYEFALYQARTASWKSGTSKSLIIIGDDVPHSPEYHSNVRKLDWKNEAKLLAEAGIRIYSVQALSRNHATNFWRSLAEITDGYHLSLNQFSDIKNLILAVGYQQISNQRVLDYENELIVNGQMNRNLDSIFSSVLKRKSSYVPEKVSTDVGELKPVSPSRFQVMKVDSEIAIKEFVLKNGIEFKIGRGFYEFTKRVEVQSHKEIILMDKKSGNFYSGNAARQLAGIPVGVSAKVSPENLPNYYVFIQSTSVNRKLLKDTRFLYEVPDFSE